ncbi:hypothetical protein C8R41DRAFT_619981 [Lentinula lateritia]|uniref:WW domain-containing protein n=1 Tax=Lentinula lateritia TaxID=40482 RepID=A0ABQ8V5Q8_9AGAR|nr:hypothetical protein C8R41DRAFT_619981 [Lentinula lateritia]
MQSAPPVNPDRRVLPPGWTEGYNAQKDTWFVLVEHVPRALHNCILSRYYVQTNVVPARISYFHPSTEYYAESNRNESGPSSSSNSYVQQGSSSPSKLQGHNEKSDWKPDRKNPILFNNNEEPVASASSGPSTAPAPSTSNSGLQPSSHLPPDSTSSVDPSSPPQYSIYSESSDEHSTPSAVVVPVPGSGSSSSLEGATTANVVSPPEYHNPSFLSSPPPASDPTPTPPPPPSSASSPSLRVTQTVGPPSFFPLSPEINPQPFPSTPHTSNAIHAVNVNSLPAPRPDSTVMNLVSHPLQAQAVNNAYPPIHTGQNPHAHAPGMNLVDRPSQTPVGVSSPSLPLHPPSLQPDSAPVTSTNLPPTPTPNVPVSTSNAPTSASATAGHEGLTLAQRLYASAFSSRPSTTNATGGPSGGRISTSSPNMHLLMDSHSHVPPTVSLAAVSAEAYNNTNTLNNRPNAAVANSFYKTGVLQNLQSQSQPIQQHRPQSGRLSYHAGSMNYSAAAATSSVSLLSTVHSQSSSAASTVAGGRPQLPSRPQSQQLLHNNVVRPQSQKIEHYNPSGGVGRPGSIFKPKPTTVPSVALIARPPSQTSGLSNPHPTTASMNSHSAVVNSPASQSAATSNTAMQGQIGVSGIQSPAASIADAPGAPSVPARPPLTVGTSGKSSNNNSSNTVNPPPPTANLPTTSTLSRHFVTQNPNVHVQNQSGNGNFNAPQTGSMADLPSPPPQVNSHVSVNNPLPQVPPSGAVVASMHSSSVSLGHGPQSSISSQTHPSPPPPHSATSTFPAHALQFTTSPPMYSTSPVANAQSSAQFPSTPALISSLSTVSPTGYSPGSVPQPSSPPSLPQRPPQLPPQRPPQHPSYTLPMASITHNPRPPRPHSTSFSFGSTSATLSNTGNMLANFGKAAGRVAGRAALRYAGRLAIGSVLGTNPTLLSGLSGGGLFDNGSLDILNSSLANLDVTSIGVDMSQFQAAFQGVPGTDYQGIINSIGQQQQTSPTPGVNYHAIIGALTKIQHAAVQAQNQNHPQAHSAAHVHSNANAGGANNYQAIVNAQAQQIQQMQAMMNSLSMQQQQQQQHLGQQMQNINMHLGQTMNHNPAHQPPRPPQTQSQPLMQTHLPTPLHTQTQFPSHGQAHPNQAAQPVHTSPHSAPSFTTAHGNSAAATHYHPQSVHTVPSGNYGPASSPPPPPPPPSGNSTNVPSPSQQPSYTGRPNTTSPQALPAHLAPIQNTSSPANPSLTTLLGTVGHGLMNAMHHSPQSSHVQNGSSPGNPSQHQHAHAQQQQQFHAQQFGSSAHHVNINGGNSGSEFSTGGSGGPSMLSTVGHETLNLWHHHQQHEHQQQAPQQDSQAYGGGNDSNGQTYDTSLLNGGNPYSDESSYNDGNQAQLNYDAPPDFYNMNNSFGPNSSQDQISNNGFDWNNGFVGGDDFSGAMFPTDLNASQFNSTGGSAGTYEYTSYTSDDQNQSQTFGFGTDGQGDLYQNTDTTFSNGGFMDSVDTTNFFDNSGDLLFTSTDETTFMT